MTIAMCYMSHEGIVLGADSTSSVFTPGVPQQGLLGVHYLNHNQKLFELGETSSLGVLTWGLGSLSGASYRTLLALLADNLKTDPPNDVGDITNRWSHQFWKDYQADTGVQLCKTLDAKGAPDPAKPTTRTKDEEQAFQNLRRNLVVGFCIAGYWLPDRTPTAFQLVFDPTLPSAPTSLAIPIGNYFFWGAPNMIKRLIFGADENIKASILHSGKWGGTDAELSAVLDQYVLGHPLLPIRDAIDFVHSCIYSTIKAMKFSNFLQVCGGPIEIAVITSDRHFRWVRHKSWDAAIVEGGTSL